MLSGTITLNAWNHVAVVRNVNAHTMYINGVSVSTLSASYTVTNAGTLYVGTGWYAPGSRIYSAGYISNVRVVIGTAVYTSAFTPITTPLTAITNTQLLTCQSNRFVDNSSNAFTVSITSAPSVQAFQPFAPTVQYTPSTLGGSGYFDGSGDRLVAPANTVFNFSTGDFTVECWVYLNSVSANQWIVGPDNTVTYPWAMQTTGTAIRFISNNAANDFRPTSFTLTTGTWNHFAVTRSGSTMRWFTNGTLNGSQTYSNSIGSDTINLQMGTTGSGSGDPLNGYITDLRVVKGTAVYTASFTPPTTPLTAITNTSLLLNYTNAAIFDNSGMGNLETVGNAQIDTSVVKYGTSSMYFDGTDVGLGLYCFLR
jgi:hypothetical protein